MDNSKVSTSKPLTVDVSENDVIAGSKDFSGFPTASTATSKMKPLSRDAIEEIAGSKDFSGFLTAHEISQALESDPSALFLIIVHLNSEGNDVRPSLDDQNS